jgi:hypothetical protein
MGSPHTLDQPASGPQATGPNPHDAQRAAFDQLNPDFGTSTADHPEVFAVIAQHLEVEATLAERVGYALNLGENFRGVTYPGEVPDPDRDRASRLAAIRDRAAATQLSTDRAEQAFDQLNPHFGVPADTHHPLGQQAVHDREAALALGTRVAVASSRENDRDPVIWLAGQDYRAADAIQAARTHPIRTRQGPERVGAER